ncbi:hypothetical protein [Nocardia veterana]|uniref:Uncharacterized protein n=1 Tax=Nocardia veterana TaxID=132249 RepID=A0A7X6LZ87_9NOCA|nr:hypothetical protein [Nocardia veterana]NKY87266.1 hypothetical protein [Nocardia veterana]
MNGNRGKQLLAATAVAGTLGLLPAIVAAPAQADHDSGGRGTSHGISDDRGSSHDISEDRGSSHGISEDRGSSHELGNRPSERWCPPEQHACA